MKKVIAVSMAAAVILSTVPQGMLQVLAEEALSDPFLNSGEIMQGSIPEDSLLKVAEGTEEVLDASGKDAYPTVNLADGSQADGWDGMAGDGLLFEDGPTELAPGNTETAETEQMDAQTGASEELLLGDIGQETESYGEYGISETEQMGDDLTEEETSASEQEESAVEDTEAMAAASDVEINEAHFPDAVFRGDIREKYDTDKNGLLSAQEIAAVTVMEVRHEEPSSHYDFDSCINSLEGIEYFTALKKLDCSYNSIEKLDLSKNSSLEKLDCSENSLWHLEISQNTSLRVVNCSFNYSLLSLDLSQNPKLEYLNCQRCSLLSLDVSKNLNLNYLDCYNNKLTKLDLRANKRLGYEDLDCDSQSKEVALMQEGSRYWLDLKELVGEDIANVEVSAGELKGSIWAFTEDNLPQNQLHYEYDTGGAARLSVYLNYHITSSRPLSDVSELTVYDGEQRYEVVAYLYSDESNKVYGYATGTALPDGMTYDVATNTMTLNNCALKGIGDTEAISYNGERELNLRILGKNTYENQYGGNAIPFIGVTGPARISGGGTIKLGKNVGTAIHCGSDRDYFGNWFKEGKLTIDGITIESEGCHIVNADTLVISNARIYQNNVNRYTRWQKDGGFLYEKDRKLYNMYALQANKMTISNSVIEMKNTMAAISCGSYSFPGQIMYAGNGKAEEKVDGLEWQQVLVGTDATVVMERYAANDYGDYFLITTPQDPCEASGHTGGTATCTARAKCSVCGQEYGELAAHKWGAYVTTKAATALTEGIETRTCAVCKLKESREVPKLKPTVELNTGSKLPMKLKQTAMVKVSGLAKGDKVKSYKSGDTKVVTVSAKGKLTAKKVGSAKITVTLASGLKKTFTVTVQKAAVKTSAISGLQKKLTMQKGKKITLKPVITPFTSSDKVTFSSSNKKVATVSSGGKITAKKKGTATITVKCGKQKATCKVTVK